MAFIINLITIFSICLYLHIRISSICKLFALKEEETKASTKFQLFLLFFIAIFLSLAIQINN